MLLKTRKEVSDAREERARRFHRMKEITDTAHKEGRDLKAEEEQEWERLDSEVDERAKAIKIAERELGLEDEFEGRVRTRRQDDDPEHPDDDPDDPEARKVPKSYSEWRRQSIGVKTVDTDEYRTAFYQFMLDDSALDVEEKRVLSKASAGAGLNLVPTEFKRELIDALREFGVMRQLATIFTTDAGEAIQIPTVTTHGTAAWIAENAAYSESDEVFGQTSMAAYKAGTLIKVSEELLVDSAFDLETYIRTEFGIRIGVLENTAYVVGDGAGKPTGVTTQASAGVTAASATAITADEIIDLFHSLLSPYRRNATWLMKDSTVKIVRKLKDGDNQYMWQPGLQAGQPDVILGRPLEVDPDMPAATAGLVSVLFGDFRWYRIRDVDGIAFQRLNELYAANGQVGFRAYHRTDGKLLNTAAVKKLTQL